LCLILDLVGKNGTVVGVDLSKPRLAACSNVICKYGCVKAVKNVALVEADGTSICCGTFKAERSRNKKRRRPTRRKGDSHEFTVEAFDRVLVDAECSHDGSLKHIEKYKTQWGMDTLSERMPWLDNEEELTDLQNRLLTNGFNQLKVDGVLIYSTCSFSRQQNEDIVTRFVHAHDDCMLEPLPFFNYSIPCKYSGNGSMARFDPFHSNTSGLFVARMRKKRKNIE